MTNNIQCSIESSTTKIELNSAVEGVFLVPELEGLAGLPEIRTTSGVNAGYDGGWTSAQNYDARLISIRGVIANPDVSQVEAKRRAIASLLGQGRKEQLTLRLTTEAGNSYAISVRTISCEMALQRVLTTQEFLIQLRADDPLIYDDGASAGTEAILHVQRALGGFEIDFELPLAIGGGAESTIVQNGEEMVYPIIKLYGPLHSPTVVNTTTNQQMQLNADLQYTVNWSGYENEEGSAIAISDGIENAPMSLTQLDGNAEQKAIPDEYQAVEYIQSSGTQRIETDYIFTQDDYIEIKFAPMAMGDVAMFGSYESGAVCELGLLNNEIRGNTASAGQGYTYTTGTTYTAVNQSGQWSIGGTSFGWPRNTTTTLKSFIFARNYENAAAYKPSSMKFYSLLIKRDGAIVYNFVPCYRKGDGVIGVYETVNEKFFRNAGTGYFTKGNDAIVAPTPEMPQDIKTVFGAQDVRISPQQKNLANPQVFVDWANGMDGLCSQYNWGQSSTRPLYGAFSGRSHTVRFNADTLYTKRGEMHDPSYNESLDIYEGIFEEGKQYTFSMDIYPTSSLGASNLIIRYTDDGTTAIPTGTQNQWTSVHITSVAGKTVRSLQLSYYSSQTYLDLDTLQIEEGTQKTDYTPFVGQSHEVNLGKNLLSRSLFSTLTSNGITSTLNPDGSVTLTGTSTTTWANIMANVDYSLPAGTYTFSDGLTETQRQGWITLTPTLSDGTNNDGMVLRSGSSTTSRGTKNYALPITKLRMVIESMTTGTEVNMTIKPQLEHGYRSTSFAPFIHTSRNLFNKGDYKLFNGYLNGDPTGTITANASNDIFYIACQPDTTYTISKTASKNFAVASSAVVPSADSAFTGRVSANNLASATITTDSTAQYLIVWARNGNISGEITRQQVLDTLQIELGSQATFYEPYNAQLELAKISTYQDRIYKNEDKWFIEKKIHKTILNGSESWIRANSGTQSWLMYTYLPAPMGLPATNGQLSNIGKWASLSGSNSDEGIMLVSNNLFRTRLGSEPASAADWQSFLSSTNMILYYILETPIVSEITDDTLLAQLNTISELYQGVNNISLVPSAGAQGTMEIQYATEYTIDQDVAVIDSQARTITINGQDAYHLKTPESEFLLLAPGENKLYLTSASETDEGYAEVKFKQGYLSI